MAIVFFFEILDPKYTNKTFLLQYSANFILWEEFWINQVWKWWFEIWQ